MEKKKTSSEWSEKVSCHYWFKKEDCNIGINLQKGHELILVKKKKNLKFTKWLWMES